MRNQNLEVEVRCKKNNAVFTLDDQERNLMFVKTDFQISKVKFHVCNFISLSIHFINYFALRDLDSTKILLFKLFVRYLVIK